MTRIVYEFVSFADASASTSKNFILELLSNPAATALFAGLAGAILGFLGNAVLEYIKTKLNIKLEDKKSQSSKSLEAFKMFNSERRDALRKLFKFANKLSDLYDHEGLSSHRELIEVINSHYVNVFDDLTFHFSEETNDLINRVTNFIFTVQRPEIVSDIDDFCQGFESDFGSIYSELQRYASDELKKEYIGSPGMC
jgi:hypothetical protein